jgi:hypothetical protein
MMAFVLTFSDCSPSFPIKKFMLLSHLTIHKKQHKYIVIKIHLYILVFSSLSHLSSIIFMIQWEF